ncbi:MAG: type II toxin-antitoxin system VapC family toxin [Rhizobiaceae bacterium]|nr:type II toxin-antitoxin system VapC family toxin [Rhizobiaceae bacterium]
MFLLDTNVHSELRKADRADLRVLQWSRRQNATHHHLSVMTIWEMEIGVLRIERRDPTQGIILRRWVEKTLLDFAGRILPIDALVAMRCAALHVPDPRPDRDAYIAATALVHDLTVVTRNTRDFEGTGVRLFNPWEA